MTISHRLLSGVQLHEAKQISTATTGDAGKVITPSSSVDGAGTLRYLLFSEIDTSGAGLITATGVATLTNKRITKRSVALTYAGTILVNGDLTDVGTVTLTGVTAALGSPSGTPTNGQEILFAIRQDATGGRLLTYGAAYRFPAATAPTLTTAGNKTDWLYFVYNSTSSTWDCLRTTLNL